MLDIQEQKRAQEWKQREDRIQSFMNKMADTVKKSNEAERILEKRVVQYQLEKEEKDKKSEEYKKELMKRKYDDIKQQLSI